MKTPRPDLRLIINPQPPYTRARFDAACAACSSELGPILDALRARHGPLVTIAALVSELEAVAIAMASEGSGFSKLQSRQLFERLRVAIEAASR